MRVLILCDQGNNRSVTIAGQLKYWGHDVLTAGIVTNEPDTLSLLSIWADRIIVTDQLQWDLFQEGFQQPEVLDKLQLWDVGPDIYPRPYNKELLRKVKALMAAHQEEYK